MAHTLKNLALILMSDKCYDNYFENYNIFDVTCFKALLSKCLGLAIIAGSTMVNLPQIIKIVRNKSVVGIDLLSVLFNLAAVTFHMSYSYMSGYPFSAWGDTTFLAIQTVVIAALVFYYKGAQTQAVGLCAAYAALLYVLNSGLTPIYVLSKLQSINIPLVLGSKLVQAKSNLANGSTGQLSAITVFLLFFGSLARIFTSMQETGDTVMVATFCVSTFANGIIAAQMLYYWNKPSRERKQK